MSMTKRDCMWCGCALIAALFCVVPAAVSDVHDIKAPALDAGVKVDSPAAKLSSALVDRLAQEPGPAKTWVFFRDKGVHSQAQLDCALADLHRTYNPRAIQRRAMRGTATMRSGEVFSELDLPVVPDYIGAVTATGAELHVTSRWLNAVSVYATLEQAKQIAGLSCVDRLEAVRRTRGIDLIDKQNIGDGPAPGANKGRGLDYGYTEAQLEQINLINLHDAGYTGAGVIIGILDTGFARTHEAFNQTGHVVNVLAEYDFVDDDANAAPETGDPSSQHEHGTMILGCIGSYLPGSLVGGAYNASFVLAKTEDTTGEYQAEEDNYVAGLEFIEQNGADMTTSSLGYIDWYTQDDLDGQTAVTTIAVNISTGAGVHHCNAAGNEYHDSDPSTSSIIAPADGFQVITCGAVDSSGDIVYFSSDGPTADGRVKPEVLARGSSTYTVDPFSTTGYTTASGTSLSTPLVACAVACLIEARPYWSVDQMRENLFETADYYVANGTYDPLYVLGYGIVDAYAANDVCSDAGVVELDRTKYACEDTIEIVVIDCGLDTDHDLIENVMVSVDSDTETGVEQLMLFEVAPDAAQFVGTMPVSTTDTAGTLWVAPGDTITVTYIDADDGAGNYDVVVTATATVDCTPPTISNVHEVDVAPRSAIIGFDADEPVQGIVHYGLSCDSLDDTAIGTDFATSPVVAVSGLQDNTTYYYMVEAVDEAGNVCTDPQCYMFTTPEVPDFFTELFETDFDLAGLSLMFVPGNPTDFYTGCVVGEITSLPTDPAGGTTVSLGDDASTEVSITGGNTVSLYGVSYSSFYICSNGYITFGTSDTTYSETLEDHFSLPRIAGIFDDFNPSSGGTVSYEQLADRMVVTWDGIPEYSESNSNTFQVEMYFDGTIVLSYLDVAVVDGLVGLSEGEGLDPDYFESDLSNMPSCGPRPPYAAGGEVLTDVNEPVDIELLASDDGLPDPPAALTYTIVSLPEHGDLSDPDGGVIDAVPYTLIAGNMVNYAPDYAYTGPDAFTFMVNDGGTPPDGGDSNVATISITVGGPQPVHVFMLDEDPGWSVEGDWAFGVPTGGGSHNYDPTSGYTGDNVYGYNLAGDYENEIPEYALTTTAIDCSDMTGVELRFWRWLGVESATWDHANVQVSNDGTTWTMVWEHTDSSISDTSWSQQVFDISGVADNAATVYVRWVMGETDTSVTYPGWNIDDIELWGVVPFEVATGDLNCDGYVNFDDINPFVTAMVGQAEYEAEYPDCNWLNGDTDANGTVNFDDINGFVELLAGK